MQNFLIRSVLGAICLTLISLPLPVRAQKAQQDGAGATAACSTVGVWTSSPQVTRGYNIGVVALVGNCSGSKQRITIEFTSISACGIETAIGYNRVALNPGQSIQVSVSYAIPADACPGLATINAVTTSGKGSSSSASTTFTIL